MHEFFSEARVLLHLLDDVLVERDLFGGQDGVRDLVGLVLLHLLVQHHTEQFKYSRVHKHGHHLLV